MEIAIIGSGITGLSTGLALQKAGFNPTVYEKADALNEIGAGVWLQPNAIWVMQWLGIKDIIESSGAIISKMEITYPSLIPIKSTSAEMVTDEFGNQTIAIHRAKLQQILYREFTKTGKVKLGMEYLSHQEIKDKVEINFRSGSVKADLVLGADGIHSKVRDQLFQNSSLRDAHQLCWRGISQYMLPHDFKSLGKEAWGRKIRFGFSQVSDNQVYWFAVASSGSVSLNTTKEKLIQMFKAFHPMVAELIQNTSSIHQGPLKDLERLDTWHKGRICLLGDAAHATTPNMGQGACQGIEDAYYICQYLKQHLDHLEAFLSFELSRRRKVDYIVNNSWNFGKYAHSVIGQQILKLIMKVTPEKIMNQQMKKLFAIDIFHA